MAIFRMQITPVRRREGRRAVSAAAYRAGERLRDESSGRLYNHAGRRDVLHKEIVVPAAAAGRAPAWVRDRASLWNAAERAESGYHARAAREYQVGLPAELGREGGVRLAQAFAHRISERYGVAVDLAVHAPRDAGDERNFHAHLLSTTRLITAEGLGAKTGLDLTARERQGRGLPDHPREYRNVRALWSQLTNEALHAAGLTQRVDHRSLAEQGSGREPLPSLPIAAVHMERRGVRSRLADTLRRHYAERLERRPERMAWQAAAQARAARARQDSPADMSLGPVSMRREPDIAAKVPAAGRGHGGLSGPARREDLEIRRQRPPAQRTRSGSAGLGLGEDGSAQMAQRVRQAAVDSWRQQRETVPGTGPERVAWDSGQPSARRAQDAGRQADEDPGQARRQALAWWLRQRRQREAELQGPHEPLPGLAPRPAWELGM
jgi:hypothetical protein